MIDIIGCWRLVQVRATGADGAPITDHQYGPSPMGIVQFTPERMHAAVGDGRAEMPPGKTRFWVSYGGPWRFDGAVLVTKVDVTSMPDRMGTDQVRQVRADGTRIWLSPPAREVDGVLHRLELQWERVG
ncbi:lipocalin-like domain-containing protein [Siccirubricoccus sp. KC 17139]|uniref:Lipocalin-like domain-containing protein n=1 Tax=Siccirubricoccus soli TaxID=2899147 RepID=A0ABT1D751_9PROT|nr:lipocalin-like domain-containing protein [Siccirubricoccus soli]MCO6416820.1 lipocalin-like domain-containing protein [Siccirubricoccus soli]MCP2682955.1 lipocalin-like domain-containing protein [Siccirubricoccus soli]